MCPGGAVFVESDCANAGATPVISAASTSIAADVERACLMLAPREMDEQCDPDGTCDERRATLGVPRARVNDRSTSPRGHQADERQLWKRPIDSTSHTLCVAVTLPPPLQFEAHPISFPPW